MSMHLDSAMFISHHDHGEDLDDHHHQPHLPAIPPRITLRTPSKSDPHLDIPHLLMSQDADHPSLNRVLSGMFDTNAAMRTPAHSKTAQELRTPISVANQLAASHQITAPTLTSSTSSAALLSDPAVTAPPLRKSSSAVDWNTAITDLARKPSFNQQVNTEWSSGLLETGRNKSFGNLSSQVSATHPQLPVDLHYKGPPSEAIHQGGLVMSSSSDRAKQMMPVNQMGGSPFSQHLATTTSSSGSSTSASLNPLDPQAHTHEEHAKSGHSGMFGSMFKGGFFARPVMRSEEENYRYLMALDR